MIATTRNPRRKSCSSRWNDKFLQLLPSIREQAEYAFRSVPVDAREELVHETIAAAYGLFVSLCRRGRSALVYPTPLAKFAIRHVREGRRIGSRCNSLDITSPCSCAAKRTTIERLDRFNPRRGEWREVLIEDRTAGPAQTAAARIDWSNWLRSLSGRQRAIACTLASGETTGVAARKFKISQARISQLRTWFRDNWNQFHGETPEKQPSVKACSH
ncbi:MAG TPA: hypothetical protein VMR25_00255 [Planctomycetaceae bacterium]|nr:hypothetical protein [Planctomycetaceae bacterium]